MTIRELDGRPELAAEWNLGAVANAQTERAQGRRAIGTGIAERLKRL